MVLAAMKATVDAVGRLSIAATCARATRVTGGLSRSSTLCQASPAEPGAATEPGPTPGVAATESGPTPGRRRSGSAFLTA